MRVRFYATLRDLVGVNETELPVSDRVEVRQVLERLTESYSPLHDKLWDAEGAWSGFVTVLLNGRSVEWLQGSILWSPMMIPSASFRQWEADDADFHCRGAATRL